MTKRRKSWIIGVLVERAHTLRAQAWQHIVSINWCAELHTEPVARVPSHLPPITHSPLPMTVMKREQKKSCRARTHVLNRTKGI